MVKTKNTQLIAPCGMNCGICAAYLRTKNPCHGCRAANLNKPVTRVSCTIKNCTVLKDGKTKFCFACKDFPCERLRHLDKRYRTKYHMSMLENLENIKKLGIQKFATNEQKRWACSNCGGTVCVHTGRCVACQHGATFGRLYDASALWKTMAVRLKKLDQKTAALWAADCAEHLLPYFEKRYPKDKRPQNAINAARAWARGKIRVGEARKAAQASHAAARKAKDPAAIAAARAAGHAAATAHVATHAVGVTYYGLKAVPNPTKEYDWQYRHLLAMEKRTHAKR